MYSLYHSLLKKCNFFLFMETKFQKVIFDLFFTFFSHKGKEIKNYLAHFSLTYIHIFCSSYISPSSGRSNIMSATVWAGLERLVPRLRVVRSRGAALHAAWPEGTWLVLILHVLAIFSLLVFIRIPTILEQSLNYKMVSKI